MKCLRSFILLAFSPEERNSLIDFTTSNFPPDAQSTLLELPVARLSKQPLLDLLEGFKTDLHFAESESNQSGQWPIKTMDDLLQYGRFVAGTVAELCLDLVFFHHGASVSLNQRDTLKQAGVLMGQALQTINISRDIQVDAHMNRVYIPEDLLHRHGLSTQDVLQQTDDRRTLACRGTLLDCAFDLHQKARPAIEELPAEARGPMRVAVESYMEIGRVLKQQNHYLMSGRATVSKMRRLRVAWRALSK